MADDIARSIAGLTGKTAKHEAEAQVRALRELAGRARQLGKLVREAE